MNEHIENDTPVFLFLALMLGAGAISVWDLVHRQMIYRMLCDENHCSIKHTVWVTLPGAYVTNAKKLLAKSFSQKAWLWLGDVLASANHSQAFC